MAIKPRICPECGKEYNHAGLLCQHCSVYFRKHPEGRYPIPKDGELAYATNGDIICHECGEAYPKLIPHVYNSHQMSHNEYCDKHKFLHTTKFTSDEYQKMMQDYVYSYEDVCIKDNLINGGKNTRIVKGKPKENQGRHLKRKITQYKVTSYGNYEPETVRYEYQNRKIYKNNPED